MPTNHPTAFISYSWDDELHKGWVKDLAARLRADGVDVTLDQWSMAPGDRLTVYMEQGISNSQFVIIVCTPRYKKKSDRRAGGVGYEENIITSEVLATQNERKFIPVLANGEWQEAAPIWLAGKLHIDLRGPTIPQPRYDDLVVTIHGIREGAPPLGPGPARPASATPPPNRGVTPSTDQPPAQFPVTLDPVRIVELIADETTIPRNDGTRGSALYAVPFRLSRTPSSIWEKAFLQTWDRPPRFTTMHRPGIASIEGDRVILDGTTVEEVERYHRETLLLAVSAANEIEFRIESERIRKTERQIGANIAHRMEVAEAAKRIKFE